MALWGAATGIQDSTVKAYVADLVPSSHRSTAYGVIRAVQGVGVTRHPDLLASCIAGLQVGSLLLLLRTLRSGG